MEREHMADHQTPAFYVRQLDACTWRVTQHSYDQGVFLYIIAYEQSPFVVAIDTGTGEHNFWSDNTQTQNAFIIFQRVYFNIGSTTRNCSAEQTLTYNQYT
jgi:hypothetical protein